MNQSVRNPYFDNAKFLLMILVVFAHLLQPFMGGSRGYHDLYYFIFTFHMPAFVFLAGYFAKPITKVEQIVGYAKKLLLPYLFFQIFYSFYYWGIGLEDSLDVQIIVPQWSLWFILSLFFWHLSLIFFQRMTGKKAVFISVGLSLFVGYLPFIDRMLTLQRMFVFLPFFIIGYFLPKDTIHLLEKPIIRRVSYLFLPMIYLFISQFHGMNKYMVFGSKPYEDYLSYPLFGGFVRGIFLVIGLIGIVGFLNLVPRQRLFFTEWGKNTVLVYLLQGIFIKGLRNLSISELNLSVLGLFALFIVSILLTIILASNPVKNIYQRLEKPLYLVTAILLPFLLL